MTITALPHHGWFALVLHAHLPFVRHPEHEYFVEEDWFFEALTEVYLPLLRLMKTWQAEKINFRLTISLSPTLIAMLSDELLKKRYARYLAQRRNLAEAEIQRTAGQGHLNYLAEHYRDRLRDVAHQWDQYNGNLLPHFAQLQQQGLIDILACAATHAYLPLLQANPKALWAQIKTGVDAYHRAFGTAPTGIWLPECGYDACLDDHLAKAGLRYYVLDTHGITLAQPQPRFGVYAPLYSEPSGMLAFGRDPESSAEVWSRDQGYPGDPIYRDFYRDIGFDLDWQFLANYLKPEGVRRFTGIKYHKITGDTDQKELYDPYWGRQKALEHARDFLQKKQRQAEGLRRQMDRLPIIVAPYDAELFGHWWYEGPWWLDGLVRAIGEQEGIALTHLRDYWQSHPQQQLCHPAQSSWGEGGYHQFWLNAANDWIQPHLFQAAERMVALAQHYPDATGLTLRALNQAARQLLLAQASDWPFILKTGTVVDYASRRIKGHLSQFFELARQIQAGTVAESSLKQLESRDLIFSDLDYRVYR